MNELAGRRHGHGLDVGGHVAQDGEQAVEEGLQPVVSARDYLIKEFHNYVEDQEIITFVMK